MNLTELTDEQLEAHAETVRQEQVRRQNLAQAPETIARLAQQYRDAGGDQAELETAVARVSKNKQKPLQKRDAR